MPDPAEEKVTLYDVANVYVTHAAAAQYAAFCATQIETARRALTRVLLDATEMAGDPGRWRRRAKSLGHEVQARVDMEDDLAVVVDIRVRPYGRRS